MSYCTQAQIETTIPAPVLNDALDDDRDGTADTGVLTNIIAQADQAVDAFLGGIYTVPFETPPAAVREASYIFACELVYARRQVVQENPFTARADAWRTRLQKIGNGEMPLDNATSKTFTPGASILVDADVDDTTR
mgnify:CR=1 FL=1